MKSTKSQQYIKPAAYGEYSEQESEAGFVSIIIAMFIMIILTLISIAFIRIVLREQRQALDYQLSRQATYAAESGINEVVQAINARRSNFTAASKTTCDVNQLGIDNHGTLDDRGTPSDPSDDIAYTCVNYNKTPANLNYTFSDDTRSKFTELAPSSGNPLDSIKITWGNVDSTKNILTNLPDCGTPGAMGLPPGRADAPPVLKADLTKINPVGNPYLRSDLIDNTDYFYFIPCNGSATASTTYNPTATPPNRGKVLSVGCTGSSTQPCSINIDGLNVSNRFFIRMRPIYAGASVTLAGKEQIPPGVPAPTQFANAQVSVDVTARSNDIVRRLRASIPLKDVDNDVPESVLQMFDGVCKQVVVDDVNGNGNGTNVTDTCKSEYGRP